MTRVGGVTNMGKSPQKPFFLSGCGSPNNFLMSKENNALVVLLAKRKVKAALRVNYVELQHKFVF